MGCRTSIGDTLSPRPAEIYGFVIPAERGYCRLIRRGYPLGQQLYNHGLPLAGCSYARSKNQAWQALCILEASPHNPHMRTHLETDLQDSLRAILSEHKGVRLAILFGSRATGLARPQSDLDIAVQMAAPMGAVEKIALIETLAAATGLPIDLIDLKQVGEPLLGQILKNGIRLLGSDKDYATLLTRHLFDEADFLPYRRRILAERRQAWIGK